MATGMGGAQKLELLFDPSLMLEATEKFESSNHAEPRVGGRESLLALVSAFEGARHFIHFSIMLYYNDKAGKAITKALVDAARRGVKVRLMVDFTMTKFGFSSSAVPAERRDSDMRVTAREMRAAGILVVDTSREFYRDVRWRSIRKRLRASGVPDGFIALQDSVQRHRRFRLNVACHRKFAVIDGETSLIGSVNVGEQYLHAEEAVNGLPSRPGLWHDGLFVIRGPFASLLNKLFASQWMVLPGTDLFDFTEHHRTAQRYGEERCTLFTSAPGQDANPIRQYFLNLIGSAEGRVIIQNPYINDRTFYKRLASLSPSQAAKITLINPYSAPDSDYTFQKQSIRCNMFGPMSKGVSFYDYSGGARNSHYKICIDIAANAVFHGSYNLNMRSARHDFEANVLVTGERFARKVKEVLEHDLALSAKVGDPGEFYRHPALQPACLLSSVVENFF